MSGHNNNNTPPLHSRGTNHISERSGQSKSSRSSSHSSSSSRSRENASSPKTLNGDDYYVSPGIPKQVPISIQRRQSSVSDRSMSSTTNNSSSNRGLPPVAPPLPPPGRSFGGANIGERGRSSSSNYTTATTTTLNGERSDSISTFGNNNGNNNNTNTTSSHFRRPSARRSPYSMRVSSITDDSMTELTFMSEAFRMDREYYDSNEFGELPPISDEGYVCSCAVDLIVGLVSSLP